MPLTRLAQQWNIAYADFLTKLWRQVDGRDQIIYVEIVI